MHEVISRSGRGMEWKRFADEVLTHIDNYTVPQYGDIGMDQIDGWDINTCRLAVIKYLNRMESNARSGQAKLDMLKAAHYICFIYQKLEEKDNV